MWLLLLVSLDYDIDNLRGHVAVPQRDSDAHLEADRAERVGGVGTREISRQKEVEGDSLTPGQVSVSHL